jgi:hypothetical protein
MTAFFDTLPYLRIGLAGVTCVKMEAAGYERVKLVRVFEYHFKYLAKDLTIFKFPQAAMRGTYMKNYAGV